MLETAIEKKDATIFVELQRSLYRTLETYSNVHRGSGHNSMVTTALFERAREIVIEYLKLEKDKYNVVFCTPFRFEFLKARLKSIKYFVLSSTELGLPLGIRAVAIKKNQLHKCSIFHTGGGIVEHVTSKTIVWSNTPERFEAGTPSIINIIAFAKVLHTGNQNGRIWFKKQSYSATSSKKILYQDEFLQLSGKELLFRLQKSLIGYNNHVPTSEGKSKFINLDNAASTPTFLPIWETYLKTWQQSGNLQKEIIQEVKKVCAEFLGAPLEEYDIIFTSNTTEAINIAAQSLACRTENDCSPVIINTILEHHSNELPWRYITSASLIRLSVNDDGFIDLEELEKILRDYNQNYEHEKIQIEIVAISGASNVLGTYNDLQSISRITHKYGARILVDGAQLVAHRKVEMKVLDLDYLAFSGHKIYAPFGSSVLVVKKDLLRFNIEEINKIKSSGEENIVGIATLGTSLLLMKQIGMDVIEDYEQKLTKLTLNGLKKIKNVSIFGIQDTNPFKLNQRGGIISFSLRNIPHNIAAKELAEERGIGIRNGCFCAHMLIQQILKVQRIRIYGAMAFSRIFPKIIEIILPGLLRVSFGLENDESEVRDFLHTVEKIAHKKRSRLKRLLGYTHNGTFSVPSTNTQDHIDKFVKSAVENIFPLNYTQ